MLLLQEDRVPAEETWHASQGDTTHFQARSKKETVVAVSVRHHILRKHSVEADIIDRHFMTISSGSGNTKRVIAVVCVPPEGSRHYNELPAKEWMHEAGTVDVMAGDFNWRASEVEWRQIIGDQDTKLCPTESFKGWRAQPMAREREMLRGWPLHLRALTPHRAT